MPDEPSSIEPAYGDGDYLGITYEARDRYRKTVRKKKYAPNKKTLLKLQEAAELFYIVGVPSLAAVSRQIGVTDV